ncbi:MAG TPA: 4'-phosphopantetheinyl transferase superfamily protein [Vicinamibacteria bacterium]|nr:4'-phosphopantetheinyl transferase superfamily protein [Vicinamibacteria bacterium]
MTVAEREVHVWEASLDLPAEELQRLERRLSPDERQRAERLRAPGAREEFVACRGRLRALLAKYVGEPPERIRFRYGVHGKPALAGQVTTRFNVSHSAGRALFAVARREVGIDLEKVRPEFPCAEIAARFFAAEEAARVTALYEDEQRQAFFASWVRQEACLKAAGLGLAFELGRLAPVARGGWSVRPLAPAPGWVAAVAAAGGDFEVHHRAWPGH